MADSAHNKAKKSASVKQVIGDDLLQLLACPACGGDVALVGEKVVCCLCQRKYPIKNGIPVLLVEQSEK